MMPHLQGVDYLAIGLYFLLMAGIGLSSGRFVRDAGSYFKGGGTIPWAMAAASNFMALFSTFVFVAYAGIAYEHGLVAVTVYWTTVPACIVGALIFAARWRRTGHTTPTEYLEERYGLGLRQTVTWFGLVMRFLDNMVRLYAIGVFIAAATPLSLGQSIIASGLLFTALTLVGGVWSVVVMSTVQCIILLLVCLILLPLSLGEAGGLGALSRAIPEHMTWFNGPKGELFWLFVFSYTVFIKFNENWAFIQRYFCVRDEAAAVKVGVVSGLLFLACTPIFMFPAVAARLILPDLPDPEMAYVALSLKLLPAGVMGIMFSSMLAATMSTVNAEYNVMAGVLITDVYQRLINPAAAGERLLRLARLASGLVGLVVIAGALSVRHLGGAFEANKLFTGILAIPLGVPLLLGLRLRRPDSLSASLTILVGVIAGVVLNAAPWLSWEAATLVETLICLAVYLVPPLFHRVGAARKAAVDAFVARIERPLTEAETPAVDPEAVRANARLFAVALAVSGALFVGMSLPSVR
ncbi:MAG TPA: hypothetical protein VF590_01690, partial [Isosphaeraceae bacterium]